MLLQYQQFNCRIWSFFTSLILTSISKSGDDQSYLFNQGGWEGGMKSRFVELYTSMYNSSPQKETRSRGQKAVSRGQANGSRGQEVGSRGQEEEMRGQEEEMRGQNRSPRARKPHADRPKPRVPQPKGRQPRVPQPGVPQSKVPQPGVPPQKGPRADPIGHMMLSFQNFGVAY